MSLKALIEDRFCKGRFIGYFEHSIGIFYKHELRCLAELFGCLGQLIPGSLQLEEEFASFHDILYLEKLNIPPPISWNQLVNPTHSPFKLATSLTLSSSLVIMVSGVAYALPTGYQSAAGNVQFQQTGNTLNVSTQASHSIANYQTFNINQGETVNFNLPNAQSVILNRVVGDASPSQILGSMNSNGQVFLTNPSGIIFGSSAQVNVGALHATTLGITDQDFLNSKYTFTQGSNPSASVINQGDIQTQVGGYVVLSGGHIENSGNIYAPQGQIDLAVGSQVSMTVDNNLAVNVTVDDTLKQSVQGLQAAITNTGTLDAPGGIIQAQAALEQNLYTQAVNNSGIIMAEGFNNVDGQIALIASPGSNTVIANSGVIDAMGDTSTSTAGNITMTSDAVINSGLITASSPNGGVGGNVTIAASQIRMDDYSIIDVSGDRGGGTALIGGDIHGTGDFTKAQFNYASPNSFIFADAGTYGNGGKVIVWSDNSTYFYGNISAQGGIYGGKGGFAEVSGKGYLDFLGNVNLLAADGTKGTLLLDPSDIVIESFTFSTPGNLVTDLDANHVSTGSNGATFSTWFDQSGNGDNATQGTGSAQGVYYSNVLNGHPSVLFNGGGDYYNFSLSALSGQNYTIFGLADVHFTIPLVSYTDNYFVGVHGTTSNGSFQYGWLDNTHFTMNNYANAITTTSGVPGVDTFGMFSTSLSTSSGRNMFINGQQVASDGFTSPLNVTASARLGKGNGAESPMDTNWYAGYISQVIAYKSALSTTDRQMVEQTMSAEWGISSGNALSNYSYITQGYLQYLSQSTNISLSATNSITIQPMSGGVLALGGSASLTLNAGGQIRMMNTTDTIRTEGGAINITGGNLILGNLNTTGAGGAKSASVTLTANSGDISVNNVTTGGGGFTVDANNNISLTGSVTTNGGTVNVNADTGLANNGFVSIGGSINSGNGGINLIGSEMIINNTVNAGTGNIYINASVSKLINVGGGIDNADSAGLFDISNPELGRLTAANVQIGNTATSGNMNVAGNVNIAGRYNLNLQNAGNFSALAQTISIGTQSLNITALGTATTGAVSGGAGIVKITSGGNMTESEAITVTGGGTVTLDTTSNGNIALSTNIGGGTNTVINANGSGTITQTGGTVYGGTVSLTSGSGDIGAVGANINTSTGSLVANTTGQVFVNNNFAGTLNLGNSTGGNGFTLYNSGGTLNVAGTLTAKSISLTSPNSILINGVTTATNGAINITADSDGAGMDALQVNNTLTATSGNISLSAGEMVINQAVNAGGNWISLKPTENTAVNIGGTTDNDDSPTLFDISAPELSRLTAGTLEIGDLAKTGNMTLAGNLNASGSYNLNFQTGGNYIATAKTITLGSKTLTIDSLGTLNTGTVSGNATTVDLTSGSTLTADGPVTVTGAGTVTLDTTSNGNIALGANVGGGTATLINANGSGTITQTGGTVLGTNITLTSGSGNIGSSVTPILTGPATLNVNTLGSAWVNDTGDTTLAASSAGNNSTLSVSATGNLTNSGAVTGGTNTDINLASASNLTTNAMVSTNGGNISIQSATGTTINAPIALTGAGTLDIATTTNGNIALAANIGVNTGTTIINANGSGTITQSAGTILGQTTTLTSGSGDIGTSLSPIQLGPTTLSANTLGNIYINGQGNLTLNNSSTGANNTLDATSSGNISTVGNVTTSGTGSISLSTTSNGSITVGSNIGGGSSTTINANGSGNISDTSGTVSGSQVTLTSGTGNIGGTGAPIQLGSTTLTSNTSGSVNVSDSGNLTLDASSAGNNGSFTASATGNLTTSGSVSGGTGTAVTLQSGGNTTIDAPVTSSGGPITLAADTNGDNSGALNIQGTVTSNNGNVAVSGSQITIGQSLSAGTGTVSITPSTSKDIQFGGTVANADSSSAIDISNQELQNITAGTLSIGNTTNTSSLTLSNNLNIASMSFSNLDLNSAGNYTGTGNTLTLGSQTVSINAQNNINTGAIAGGTNTVTMNAGNSLNVTGTITRAPGQSTTNLTSQSGNTNVDQSITGSTVNLTSQSGSINLSQSVNGSTLSLSAGNAIQNTGGYQQLNINATNGATLNAGTYIGTLYRPLNVNVNGGLGVNPLGSMNGISTDINGYLPAFSDFMLLGRISGMAVFNSYWFSTVTAGMSSNYVQSINLDLRDKMFTNFIQSRILETSSSNDDSNDFLAPQPLKFTLWSEPEIPRFVNSKDMVFVASLNNSGNIILINSETGSILSETQRNRWFHSLEYHPVSDH